ncbi:probable V-type proton ATPase subunit F [Rhagoletis pomonella]|uniref:probable V-type proton ATPase subunit F n=1 Tax=Rhagoletis pomonella TaxID=28610 RepID=UPI00177C7F77|nr:probable V-type proton ATPase subunit F [Rhagoletis pomonella]
MASTRTSSRRSLSTDSRMLIGIVADLETVIGFLLAGIGEASGSHQLEKNFMVVTHYTPIEDIEIFFASLCTRKNIGVIFVASDLKMILIQAISRAAKTMPIILEIPTKNTIVKSIELKKQNLKRMETESEIQTQYFHTFRENTIKN